MTDVFQAQTAHEGEGAWLVEEELMGREAPIRVPFSCWEDQKFMALFYGALSIYQLLSRAS